MEVPPWMPLGSIQSPQWDNLTLILHRIKIWSDSSKTSVASITYAIKGLRPAMNLKTLSSSDSNKLLRANSNLNSSAYSATVLEPCFTGGCKRLKSHRTSLVGKRVSCINFVNFAHDSIFPFALISILTFLYLQFGHNNSYTLMLWNIFTVKKMLSTPSTQSMKSSPDKPPEYSGMLNLMPKVSSPRHVSARLAYLHAFSCFGVDWKASLKVLLSIKGLGGRSGACCCGISLANYWFKLAIISRITWSSTCISFWRASEWSPPAMFCSWLVGVKFRVLAFPSK